MRILLVDDNEDHRFLTKRALAALRDELPVEPEVARDGQEALDRLLGPQDDALPDLVLLDIKMPRKDGFEVLEALRANPRTRGLHVVMMTSSENAADVARATALGADGYLTKAMDPAAFRVAIHTLVRQQAARKEAGGPGAE